MNVVAVSTPGQPGWRWRIVDYHGEMVEESDAVFATISQAVAEGNDYQRRHADRETPIVRQRWARDRRNRALRARRSSTEGSMRNR
jgi:hypothetical protein